MEGKEFLASRHRAVVTEFIEAVVEEWAGDMGDLERNILGVALRQEIETMLVPGLLAVDALLLGANAKTLGWLPEWLDRVSTALPGDAEFLTEMGRVLDPPGYDLLEGERCAFARGVGGVQSLYRLPVEHGARNFQPPRDVKEARHMPGLLTSVRRYSALDSALLLSRDFFLYSRILAACISHMAVPETTGSLQSWQIPWAFHSWYLRARGLWVGSSGSPGDAVSWFCRFSALAWTGYTLYRTR